MSFVLRVLNRSHAIIGYARKPEVPQFLKQEVLEEGVVVQPRVEARLRPIRRRTARVDTPPPAM